MAPTWRLVHHSGQGAPTAGAPGAQASVLRQAREAPLAPGEHLDVERHVRDHWRLVGRRRAGGALLRLVLVVGEAPPATSDWFDALVEA